MPVPPGWPPPVPCAAAVTLAHVAARGRVLQVHPSWRRQQAAVEPSCTRRRHDLLDSRSMTGDVSRHSRQRRHAAARPSMSTSRCRPADADTQMAMDFNTTTPSRLSRAARSMRTISRFRDSLNSRHAGAAAAAPVAAALPRAAESNSACRIRPRGFARPARLNHAKLRMGRRDQRCALGWISTTGLEPRQWTAMTAGPKLHSRRNSMPSATQTRPQPGTGSHRRSIRRPESKASGSRADRLIPGIPRRRP